MAQVLWRGQVDEVTGHSSHHGEGDKYTLLHLAVLNDHLDALQRLLNTGEIEINKPTLRQGRSALFLAAQAGRVHAVTMLLEHNADGNALTDEGQSALIVAASKGHKKIVQLLQDHGASTQYQWMALTADDVARARGANRPSGSDRSSDRESEGKNGTVERPLIQGQPGWMSDSTTSPSSSLDRSLAQSPGGGSVASSAEKWSSL